MQAVFVVFRYFKYFLDFEIFDLKATKMVHIHDFRRMVHFHFDLT